MWTSLQKVNTDILQNIFKIIFLVKRHVNLSGLLNHIWITRTEMWWTWMSFHKFSIIFRTSWKDSGWSFRTWKKLLYTYLFRLVYTSWLLYSFCSFYPSAIRCLSHLRILNPTLYSIHKDRQFSFHFPCLENISYQSIFSSLFAFISLVLLPLNQYYFTNGLNFHTPRSKICFNQCYNPLSHASLWKSNSVNLEC